MIICKSCGKEVDDNGTFCSYCGYNLKESLEGSQESSINTEHIEPDSNKLLVNDNNNVVTRGIRYFSNRKKTSIAILIAIIIIASVGISIFRSNKLNHDIDAFKQLFNNKEYGTAQQIYDKDKNNKKFSQQILSYISGKISETKEKYINKGILVSEAESIIENTTVYKSDDSKIVMEYIQNLEQSKHFFDLAYQELKQNKFYNAIEDFSKVIESDENYKDAREQIKKALPKMKKQKLLQAEQQYKKKEYENAINTITDALNYNKDDKELIEKKAFYINEKGKADTAEKERKQAEEKRKQDEEKRKKAEEERKKKLKELNAKKQLAINKIKAIVDSGDQITQLKQNLNRNGKEYFVYSMLWQGEYEGDMRFCVDISTLDISVMYSDNTFMSYDQYIKQANEVVIDVSIDQINKSVMEYSGKKVSFTGTVSFIKENFGTGDMLLSSGQNLIHVSYSQQTSFNKGSTVTVIGTVSGQTGDYTLNGNQVTIPSVIAEGLSGY